MGLPNLHKRTAAIQLTLLAALCPVSASIAADDELAGGFISAVTYRGYVQELRSSWFEQQYDVQQAAFALGYAAGVHDSAASISRVCSPDDVSLKEVVIKAFDRINDERGGRSVGGTWNTNRYSRSGSQAAAAPVARALSWAFPCEEESDPGRSFVSLQVYEGYYSHFENFARGARYDEHEATYALAYAVGVYDFTTEQESVCAPTTVQMLSIPSLRIERSASEDSRAGTESAADSIGRALQQAYPCVDE